ncbi:hypothetical protein niasHS_010222 [Heterodera schachtii]|uniref:HTH CENPB-type domain-containing protein n=1 Tax=Heterodera schachtii TaxID=97005 RepID=A0ABD2IZL7_HETSC
MAATSFADYMARVSASMIHAALANAAEKAAAAAHHQQQQQNRANGAAAVIAGTACASPPLVPFFPLPLLTLPPVAGQMQMPNGTTTTNGADDGKMKEQREEKQRNSGGNATQGTNGKTTSTKANRNGANGGGKATTTAFGSGDNDGTEQKQQQSDGDKQRQPNKSQNDGPKKRKRPSQSTPTIEETPKQQKLIVKTEHHSSESPLSTSRISSPDSVPRSGNGRGARKLKLYVAEEKVDIIDYAKCIGNRAAGREFSVAESSIREWRKNEEKIRRQAESTLGCTQHFEQSRRDILAWIDDELVKAVAGEKGEQCTTSDWYAIAAKARQLWAEKAESSDQLDGSEMKITMGWVSRFMRRNENRVPKIAPPIIATGNGPSSNSAAVSCCSASSGNAGGGGSAGTAGLSMVKSNPRPVDSSDTKQEETSTKVTRPKRTSRAAAPATMMVEERPQKRAKTATTTAPNGPGKTNGTAQPRGKKGGTSDRGDGNNCALMHESSKSNTAAAAAAASSPQQQQTNTAVPTASSRRRKCLKPMRVDATCATLLTTSSPTDKQNIGGMP